MKDSFLSNIEGKSSNFKQKILGLCVNAGDYSIAELSKELNASIPTITRLVGELIEDGFLEDLGKKVRAGSLCGLGQTAPNPVLATLRYFRNEYLEHVEQHRCRALSCSALVDVKLDQSRCIKCKLCIKGCPVGAISDDFVVDNSLCTRCNSCIEVCPKKAIGRVEKGEGSTR